MDNPYGGPTLDTSAMAGGVEAATCVDSPSGKHESAVERYGDDLCIWCMEVPAPHWSGSTDV